MAVAAFVAFVLAPLALPSFATAGDYIVVLREGSVDPGGLAAQHGKAYGFQARFVYRAALRGYAAGLSARAAAAIAADPRVAFVAPDYPMEAKPCVLGRESPSGSDQCLPTGVDRIDGDLSSTTSGDGSGTVDVDVAVLDTGIDLDHPDLNVVGGVNCSNGRSFDDPEGHGTMVAGIIGARDDGSGVVGVAPGARLWAVRVLKKTGQGTASSIACGIDWVTATRTDADPGNDIEVANMSLGAKNFDDENCGLTKPDAVHLAICNSVAAGVIYVVAAGNSASDLGRETPASFAEVLTATSMNDVDGQPGTIGSSPDCLGALDDRRSGFSNFATLAIDQVHTIAAPGACIRSTTIGGGYGIGDGTSFATPHVAGTVALCIAAGPCSGMTPAEIIQKIRSDAEDYNLANTGYGFFGDPIDPIPGQYFGYLIRAAAY